MTPVVDFSLPTIPLHLPTWAMLAIGGFALVALGLGGSVLLAGRKMQVSRHGILSFAQAMLWVIPALLVVGLIASSTQTGTTPIPAEEPVRAETKRDLIRSRTTSSEVPDFARPAPDEEKKGLVARLAGAVLRRVKAERPQEPDSLSFSSGLYVREEQAAEELTPVIQTAVQEKLQEGFPIRGNFTVPVRLIDQFGVKESVLQTQDVEIKDGEKERMVTLHVKVQFAPELRTAVANDWKGQLVTQRLTQYGAGVGLITALATMVAGYLGLNQVTQGQYTWRLRLAAIAGAAATGIMVLVALAQA